MYDVETSGVCGTTSTLPVPLLDISYLPPELFSYEVDPFLRTVVNGTQFEPNDPHRGGGGGGPW